MDSRVIALISAEGQVFYVCHLVAKYSKFLSFATEGLLIDSGLNNLINMYFTIQMQDTVTYN